jgi:RNA polymerase sigma-70 factor (ECF subfamily)
MRKPPPPSFAAEIVDRILREHGPFLRSIAQGWGLDEADTDDVIQLVAETLLRNASTIPESADLRPWLRGVTSHMVFRYFQEQRRQRMLEQLLQQHAPSLETPTGEDVLRAKQSRKVVHEAIDALAPELREVLVRHEIDEEPVAAIAASQGVKKPTAHNRLRLARDELAVLLRRRAAADRRKGGRSFAFLPLLLLRQLLGRARDGLESVVSPAEPDSWGSLAEPASRGSPAEPDSWGAVRPGSAWRRAATRRPVRGATLFCVAALLLVCSPLRPWGDAPAALAVASSSVDAVAGHLSSPPAASADPSPGPLRSSSSASPVVRDPAAGQVLARRAPRSSSPPRLPAPSSPAPPHARDLAVARALIDRAQRAALHGDRAVALETLRQYDAEAPDNPFAAVRAGVVRALQAGAASR